MSRDRSGQDGRAGRPLPPRLDPRAGRPPRSHPDRPAPGCVRTRRGVRAARILAVALSATLLAVSGWGWYLGRVAEATVNRTDAIPTSGNEGSGNGSALNLLLVGSDSRADLTPQQRAQLNTGGDAGLNTDTMILVHIPADGSKASFVSFPRDSYVQIPGVGWDKLNAAYAYGYASAGSGASESQKQAGGAQLLVRTVSQLSGLQIDHYAQVDLLGFFNLSTVVGGVEVNLCKAVKDRKSGATFPAGPQTISGADALKFVRQRYGLPRGDFDRIVRQQTFIAGVLRKMLSQNVLMDPAKQRQLVQAAAKSLTVDQSLNLFQLAQQMQSVTASSIDFQTLPYVGDDTDGQGRYILRLKDQNTLRAFFANLSADPRQTPATPPAPPQTVAPSAVRVAVLNGSGTAGLAAATKTGLESAGFVVASTGNADSGDYTRTEIRYAAGDEALARTLAAAVPGAKSTTVDGAARGTVALVLGSDFSGVGQAVTAKTAKTKTAAAAANAAANAAAATPTGEKARTAADTSCIN